MFSKKDLNKIVSNKNYCTKSVNYTHRENDKILKRKPTLTYILVIPLFIR